MQLSKVRNLREAYREGTGLQGLVSVSLATTSVVVRIADGALIPHSEWINGVTLH